MEKYAEYIVHCKICNITTNKYNYHKHLQTQKHKKRAQLKNPKPIPDYQGDYCRCTICDRTVRANCWFSHLNSLMHKNKIDELGIVPKKKAQRDLCEYSITRTPVFAGYSDSDSSDDSSESDDSSTSDDSESCAEN